MLAAADATLLGLAAIITALAGVISAVWGWIKSRKEGKEEADDRLRTNLRDCRAEAEQLADELHRVKMTRFDREK